MSNNQLVEIDRIVKKNVEGVLKQYLTDDIARRITNEIRNGIVWDLGNTEG